jgi:hypothetical protein
MCAAWIETVTKTIIFLKHPRQNSEMNYANLCCFIIFFQLPVFLLMKYLILRLPWQSYILFFICHMLIHTSSSFSERSWSLVWESTWDILLKFSLACSGLVCPMVTKGRLMASKSRILINLSDWEFVFFRDDVVALLPFCLRPLECDTWRTCSRWT